ncbi:MAG: hypothetical protein AAF602_17770, partial [Myxococcota bacterium]
EEDYLFQSCNEVNIMAGLPTRDHPSEREIGEIPQVRSYEKSKPYWYQYLGPTHVEAEKGCSYDFDFYANWEEVATKQKAEIEGKEVRWRSQHTFATGVHKLGDRDKPLAIAQMVRYKTCADGKRTKLDVVCEAGRLMDVGAAAPKPEPAKAPEGG